MDIREFTTYQDNSPVTGYGVWIVIENGGHRAHLLHPTTLTELTVTEYEFKKGSGKTLWPTNSTGVTFSASRFMQSFKNRIAFFIENGRPFPITTVAKAIAGLEEIEFDQAMSFISSLRSEQSEGFSTRTTDKATRSFRIRDEADHSSVNGRPRVILDALKDSGPATIYQITSMVEGKLNTKSDLSRVVTYFVNKLTSQGFLEIVT